MVAAEAFLALRDSMAALIAIRRMTDTTLLSTPFEAVFGLGPVQAVLLWPRAMLLRADLESSIGEKLVAVDYYKKFLDLWSSSDPEFAPLIARVRASLAKLEK